MTRSTKSIPIRDIDLAQKGTVDSGRFNIRDLRTLLGGKDMVQELHRHNFFYLLALKKGAGNHSIDFTTYTVSNNSIFFMRPGQVHQLVLNAGSTGYLIGFDRDFYHPATKTANQRFRTAGNQNFCKPGIDRFKKLYTVLTHIFEEYTARQEAYQDVIKANLDIFFIEMARQSRSPKKSVLNGNQYAQSKLEEFLELLETNLTELKQVSDYADLLHLSVYQLNGISRSTMGKTPSELINEYIILEAKRQLLATPNQVKDIAYQLGYEDVSYFTRFFKKHTGHTPEAFRHY